MKSRCFTLILLLVSTSAANAWNSKGHMTVARLAWNQLTPEERGKIVAMLKSHPHYDELLAAGRPANFPEDEWVFLQAATWSDWIKSHHTKDFSKPDWHYIDYPLVAAGSAVTPPALKDVNVVKAIESQKTSAMNGGNQGDRALALTWLFHLLGDVHQPLHATTRYSDNFPTGDRGGNDAVVRVSGGGTVHLHPMWDGLLGNTISRSSILGTVAEAESFAADNAAAIKADLEANTTPEAWAKESFALAAKFVYEDGNLKPANVHDHPEVSDIPTTGPKYAENAGRVARINAYKGGKRLAQVLREVLKANE